jgi:metal-responsive CopG/Arc/MetJ family transcriptional regulator
MRTMIDIPDALVKTYDTIAGYKKVSRAELIRQAMEHDVKRLRQELLEMSFGAWRDNPVDGLALQRKIRDEEWD